MVPPPPTLRSTRCLPALFSAMIFLARSLPDPPTKLMLILGYASLKARRALPTPARDCAYIVTSPSFSAAATVFSHSCFQSPLAASASAMLSSHAPKRPALTEVRTYHLL